MKQHFESISRFRVKRLTPDFNYVINSEDRWHVSKMCIKVADIGHAAINWSQHFEWSCRVVEEFYLQGDEEKTKGLTVSALCDREKHSEIAKSQGGFLRFVVKPLFEEIAAIDGFDRFKNEVLSHLELNENKWKSISEEKIPVVFKHKESELRATFTTNVVKQLAGAGLESLKSSENKTDQSNADKKSRVATVDEAVQVDFPTQDRLYDNNECGISNLTEINHYDVLNRNAALNSFNDNKEQLLHDASSHITTDFAVPPPTSSLYSITLSANGREKSDENKIKKLNNSSSFAKKIESQLIFLPTQY